MEYATRCTLKDLLEKREKPLKEEVIINRYNYSDNQ